MCDVDVARDVGFLDVMIDLVIKELSDLKHTQTLKAVQLEAAEVSTFTVHVSHLMCRHSLLHILRFQTAKIQMTTTMLPFRTTSTSF